MQWRWLMGTGLAIVLACGDDGAPASGADGTGASDGGAMNDEADVTGSAPPPGPSAEGWESNFNDGGVRIDCDQDLAAMQQAGAPTLSIDDVTLVVGYEQVGNNQNPIVARFDAETMVWCTRHETEGPDGRALGLAWDGGDVAYVVYTIVGGGSSLEGKGGWVPSYAPGSISGGGPKVSYVGRVQTTDGTLDAGSFIIAVKSDNTVNSHTPAGPPIVQPDGNVRFLGSPAHKPIDEGWVAMDCTDYPFSSTYVLSPDLSEMVCAECTQCVSQRPCS
ncbi:MAG: hypothetical protein AAF799_16220 [Myxococcota bacterium]